MPKANGLRSISCRQSPPSQGPEKHNAGCGPECRRPRKTTLTIAPRFCSGSSQWLPFHPIFFTTSPRLNDLANRSNQYLTSKRFLLITFRFRATISHGTGAPATECRSAFLITSLPALFSELCVDSAPSASLYPEPRRERYPLPEKYQNSDVNYL